MHAANKEASNVKDLIAAGSTTQFVKVEEEQDVSSDEESVMQRVAEDDASSMISGSVMQRVVNDDESEASQMVRVEAGDDVSDLSGSVM